MSKKIYLSLSFILVANFLFAQNWNEEISKGENFYKIRESFDIYKNSTDNTKSGPIKPFERWANRMNERTYPTGELTGAPNYYKLIKGLSSKSSSVKSTTYPSWTNLGPSMVPFGTGNGRVNFVEFDPIDQDIVYIGSPSGGIWKSLDGGITFSILNDTLPVIGCSDLAIDPSNTNILYLATGDRDARDTYSIGVLKSIDGGISWDTTSLEWEVNELKTIGRLAINPMNPQMIFAATSDGVYRTINGGASWNRRIIGDFKDVHFKPGDSSTIYVSGTEVYYSTDAGVTFNSSNVFGNIQRIELAVTNDDPNVVFAVSNNGSNYGLDAIWKSTNSGVSFSKVYNRTTTGNKDLLAGDASGNTSGGQSWYNMALAVSPFDKDRIIVGGTHMWGSSDGGNTFNLVPANGNIHVDHHHFNFRPGTNDLYVGCDGGVYKSENFGTTFTNLTESLQISQSYSLGISQITPGFLLIGNQDNGTIRRDTLGFFTQVNGGDGMECIIDNSNDNITYATTQNGNIYRAENFIYNIIGGNGINGIGESGAWETPYLLDPFQNQVLFAGYNNIYKTTNSGLNWTKMNNSSYPGNGKTNELRQAPWNLDMLIATKGSNIYLTENSGATFTSIKNGLPNVFITEVQFSPFYNANNFTAYVSMSGYSNNLKVFKTTNSGQSWTNISFGLPNIPANCIVIDPTTPNDEQIYVGTDIGVYYKNSSMSEFELYSVGLPNVIIEEMEIQENEGKIVACTYGRGVWEVPLMSTLVSIEEQFTSNENLDLSIYPNPFSQSLELKYDLKKAGPVSIEIYDIQGKRVFEKTHSSQIAGVYSLSISEEVSKMQKGMYFLKFRTGEQEITKKIVKD